MTGSAGWLGHGMRMLWSGQEWHCLCQQGLDTRGLRTSVGHRDYLEGHESHRRCLGKGWKPSLALAKERTWCATQHCRPPAPTLGIVLDSASNPSAGPLSCTSRYIRNLTISQSILPPGLRPPFPAWTTAEATSLAPLPPPSLPVAGSPQDTQGDISETKIISSPSHGSSSPVPE